MYAFGLTIDSRMNAASCTLFFVASRAGVVSRSGPIVALEPAGRKVWQAPQPLEAKTDLPWAGLPAAVVAVGVAAGVARGGGPAPARVGPAVAGGGGPVPC